MFQTFNIMTEDEVDKLLLQLNKLEWKQGKARTEELTGTIKQNLELDYDDPIAKIGAKIVSEKIFTNAELRPTILPSKLHRLFFNKYEGGGTYNRHTDAPFMRDVRTDFACTMFLTDPDTYEGGELCLEQPNGDVVKHKGKKGDCVVYECGGPHWVTPVTKGYRISGITWIQSAIKDPRKRTILKNMHMVIGEIEDKMNAKDKDCIYRKWFVDLGRTHGDLVRLWA